jgi:hypothetical protein
MAERSKPKYKVGQIVVVKSIKKETPFRILAAEWNNGGWFYAWNSKNYASEDMIRNLTPEEKGE